MHTRLPHAPASLCTSLESIAAVPAFTCLAFPSGGQTVCPRHHCVPSISDSSWHMADALNVLMKTSRWTGGLLRGDEKGLGLEDSRGRGQGGPRRTGRHSTEGRGGTAGVQRKEGNRHRQAPKGLTRQDADVLECQAREAPSREAWRNCVPGQVHCAGENEKGRGGGCQKLLSGPQRRGGREEIPPHTHTFSTLRPSAPARGQLAGWSCCRK